MIRILKHTDQNLHMFLLQSGGTYSMHQHGQIELSYVLSGQITYEINRSVHTQKKGELALVFPFQPHRLTCSVEKDTCVLLLLFDVDFVPDFEKYFCEYTMPVYTFHKKELEHSTKKALSRLTECAKTPDCFSAVSIRGWLTVVLGDLFFKHDLEKRKVNLNYPFIRSITDYMTQHMQNGFSQENLCSAFGISPFFLTHTWKQIFYVNYNTFLLALRLNYADELLQTTDWRILDIALECGFKNVQSFSRNYKKAAGLTPCQFRLLKKQDPDYLP